MSTPRKKHPREEDIEVRESSAIREENNQKKRKLTDEHSEDSDAFKQCPTEVVSHILSYLGPLSLFKMDSVAKKFKDIHHDLQINPSSSNCLREIDRINYELQAINAAIILNDKGKLIAICKEYFDCSDATKIQKLIELITEIGSYRMAIKVNAENALYFKQELEDLFVKLQVITTELLDDALAKIEVQSANDYPTILANAKGKALQGYQELKDYCELSAIEKREEQLCSLRLKEFKLNEQLRKINEFILGNEARNAVTAPIKKSK